MGTAPGQAVKLLTFHGLSIKLLLWMRLRRTVEALFWFLTGTLSGKREEMLYLLHVREEQLETILRLPESNEDENDVDDNDDNDKDNDDDDNDDDKDDDDKDKKDDDDNK